MTTFKVGCYFLLFIACSHLIGHFWPITPVNETESQLLGLMTSYQKEVLGGKMSMMDIQNGLSLCYSLFFFASGLLNLFLFKNTPDIVKTISIYNTTLFAIGSVISLIYFFWLPVISFTTATLLFGISAYCLNATKKY